MEDITLERLLNDFKGVLDQINNIIERGDIEQAREALEQIKELVYNEEKVPLDGGVEQGYDHVLHQLLSEISGVIQIEREETEQTPGVTQAITIEVIEEEIIRVEEEISRLRLVENTTSVNREEVLELIERKNRRLELLRGEFQRISNNQENNQPESEEQAERQSSNDSDEEISRLNTEISDLEEQLQRAARARVEARNSGNESEEAIANAEYSRLVSEISARRDIIAELENNSRNEENNDNKNEIERLNSEIAELERQLQGVHEALASGGLSGQAYAERLADQRYFENQIQARRNRLNELENPVIQTSTQNEGEELEEDDNLGDSEENPNNQELDDLQEQLERLEQERRSIENEYYRNLEDNKGQENDLTRQLHVEVQRRIDEINNITARIIELTTGPELEIEDKSSETERLDLEEQARIIGDNIFKTARIRKELQEREISREDFLEFYEAGIQNARDEMIRLKTNIEDIEREIGSITNSQSGENLYDQLSNCDNIEDEEEKNAEKIRVLEEIRQNFIRNGKYDEDLSRFDFLDEEITTIEQAERFYNEFFSKFERNAISLLDECREDYEEEKEDIEIFEQEIRKIREEQRSIEIAQGNLESLEHEDEEEKALRERQIRATIFGDPELEQEWNERARRFYSHKVEKTRTVDGENGTYNIRYSSIEDYPEYEEDAHFMNLDDYRRYLEITSLYENSGKNIDFMLTILDPDTVDEYEQKEAEEEGKGRKWLEEYLADKAEYVSTFHGFTNEHGVKYANYKTAGSSLKSMKPVKGDLPATTKVGNAIENTFRFFGLRRPEFSRVDEHGNKVSNTAGGLLTLATDALVIGGVTAAALSGPVGWATIGSAYAVRGGVLAGNRIAARSYYKKHKEDIDNNIPTLGNPSKDDKEVARKDYYRRVEGKNRFTSWLKAKNDRFFFRRRARETEEKVVNERVELSNAVIDARKSNAREKAIENLEIAHRNQQVRQENTRRAIRNQDFYNEVVVDPNSVDLDEALAESARNGALRSQNPNGRNADVNPNSSVPIGTKYQREAEEYEQTSNLGRVRTTGGTVAATAFTVEEKYTARQQKQDRINKIITIIGTSAARLGIESLRTGFLEQQVTQTKGADQVVPGKTSQQPVYRDETVTELDGNKRLSDLQYDDDALSNVWHDPNGNQVVHTQYARGDDPIRAFTIRATGADGQIKEVSIAQNGYGIIPGRHVYDSVDQDLSNLSVTEAIDLLRTRMPEQFEQYCEAVGLQGASSEEIAKHAIENGNLFGQTGTMAGWERVLPSNLTSTTHQVLDHMETVTTPDTIIPGAVQQTVTTVFNPNSVIDTTLQGMVGGAGVGIIDQLHEAAKQTKKVEPGTFEKRTPSLVLSRVARREQEKLNRTRMEREESDRNSQQEQEEQVEQTAVQQPQVEQTAVQRPQAEQTQVQQPQVEQTAVQQPQNGTTVEKESSIEEENPNNPETHNHNGVIGAVVATRKNAGLYRKYRNYTKSTSNPLPFEEWKEKNASSRDDR